MNELRGLGLTKSAKYQCLPTVGDGISRQANSSNLRLQDISSLVRFSRFVLNEEQVEVPCGTYSEAKDRSARLYKAHGVVSGRKTLKSKREYPAGNVPKHPPCSSHVLRDSDIVLCRKIPTSSSGRFREWSGLPSLHATEEKNTETRSGQAVNDGLSQPQQADSSILWEDRLLDTVSGSTAWYVATKCTGPTDRSRMAALVHDKYGSVDSLLEQAHDRQSKQKGRSLTGGVHRSHGSEQQGLALDGPSFSEPQMNTKKTSDFAKELSSAMQSGQTYQSSLNSPTVVFEGDKVFEKQMQAHFPKFDISSEGLGSSGKFQEKKLCKGWKRWTALPQPVESHSQWLPLKEEVRQNQSRPSTAASIDFKQRSSSREGARKWRCGHELLDMLESWRISWGITDEFSKASDSNIAEYLHYPADGVRLNALYHCISAAIAIYVSAAKAARKEGVEVEAGEKLFSSLLVFLPHLEKRSLEDPNVCVRIGCAVLLTVLGQWSEKLQSLLLSVLPSQEVTEQWLALQCLAVQGVTVPQVVDCLLLHANQCQSPSRRSKAMELLARLSTSTTLVYATVCELLNSSGWQERLTACTILPMLAGQVTKDMCDKLIVLLWKDWSPEVRHRASEALGKLGKGKLIHDELCRKLATEDERIRLDALRKVVNLQLMTAQMLPAFLTCFRDPHISVRIEACSVAAEMGLDQKEVTDVLLFLTDDPSVKVKAHAMRCLGKLGTSRADVLERLLWRMRFDRNPDLRAEACEAVRVQGFVTKEVVEELQMLVSHDDSDLVLRIARQALIEFGFQPRVVNKMESKIAEEIGNLTTLESVLHSCTKH